MHPCNPNTEEKFLKTLGTFITVNKVYSTVCYAALVFKLLTLFPVSGIFLSVHNLCNEFGAKIRPFVRPYLDPTV